MSTDKTLADVQPGGRVRLAGSAPTFNWKEGVHDEDSLRLACMAWENLMYEDSAGEYTPEQHDQIGRMLVNVEQMMEGHPFTINEEGRYVAKDAALSAQPSPGGQGVGVSISDDDRAVLQRLQDALPTAGINGWAKGVEVLERLLRDSLAARQPVGEPVTAIGVIDEDEGGFVVQLYPSESLPLGAKVYTTPPAQAVDLEQFVPKRKPGPDSYEEDDSEAHYSSGWNDCRGAMLALIDSQAVGK